MMSLSERIKHSKKRAAGRRGQSGFRLSDLLVTLFLIMVFLIGVVVIVAQALSSSGADTSLSALNRDGNGALDRIEALIRGCTRIDDSGRYTNENSFRFFADLDGDGSDGTEDVRIFGEACNGTTKLMVTVDSVYTALLSNLNTDVVEPLKFTYYSDRQHQNEVTSSYDETVRVVKVEIDLKKKISGEAVEKVYERSIRIE